MNSENVGFIQAGVYKHHCSLVFIWCNSYNLFPLFSGSKWPNIVQEMTKGKEDKWTDRDMQLEYKIAWLLSPQSTLMLLFPFSFLDQISCGAFRLWIIPPCCGLCLCFSRTFFFFFCIFLFFLIFQKSLVHLCLCSTPLCIVFTLLCTWVLLIMVSSSPKDKKTPKVSFQPTFYFLKCLNQN